jgi:hypothetical protein
MRLRASAAAVPRTVAMIELASAIRRLVVSALRYTGLFQASPNQ